MIVLLAVQMSIIPRLRKPVLVLGRQRQISARQLAGRIAETADGVHEIHVHGAANYERADISERLGRIFKIRFDLYQKKFIAKFWNNILSQATPFAIYLIGGYFAITGQMDVGAVVGVLLAYKDLPSPIKELIDWDQQRQDVQIKYEQVIDQFQPEGMMPPELQVIPDGPPPPLGKELALAGVDRLRGRPGEAARQRLAHPADQQSRGGDRRLGLGQGRAGPGAGAARPCRPAARSSIDGKDFFQLPEYVIGARHGLCRPGHLPVPAVGARQSAVRPEASAGRAGDLRRGDAGRSARRSGRSPSAPAIRRSIPTPTGSTTSWPAPPARPTCCPAWCGVLKQVELDEDIYSLGLRGTDRRRRAARPRREDPEGAPYAARAPAGRQPMPAWSSRSTSDHYNKNLSVAENLLFGTPVGKQFDGDNLAADPYVQSVLKETGLDLDLQRMGLSIAETMVELFSGLSPDNPLFEQYSFISADELPNVRLLLQRLGGKGIEAVPEADRARLMTLPFRYIEARHRLGLIDAAMEERLLAARRAFADGLPANLRDAVEFYDFERYNSAATLQDNILFGRLVYGQAQAGERIGTLIAEVLDELGLRDSVIEVGLEYNVGVGGKRLPATQRQKLGIARALIKRPQLLVVNEAVAMFDGRTQDRIRDNILASVRGGSRRGLDRQPAQPGGAVRPDRRHAGRPVVAAGIARPSWRHAAGSIPS